jgi:hypothetical protein
MDRVNFAYCICIKFEERGSGRESGGSRVFFESWH